jgi:hypothetical protein
LIKYIVYYILECFHAQSNRLSNYFDKYNVVIKTESVSHYNDITLMSRAPIDLIE